MKWYNVQFDPSWVRCANHNCAIEYLLKAIRHKRKCPNCGMDNHHYLKVTK